MSLKVFEGDISESTTKISELIDELEKFKEEFGDIPVMYSKWAMECENYDILREGLFITDVCHGDPFYDPFNEEPDEDEHWGEPIEGKKVLVLAVE